MGDGKTHAKEYTKEHMSVPYNINILIHTVRYTAWLVMAMLFFWMVFFGNQEYK